MNNDFGSIFDVFLSLITDYDLVDMGEDDLKAEVELKMKIATSKIRVFKGLEYSSVTGFNRQLSSFEITIIGHATVIEWLNTHINHIELFRPQMSSKDFTQFSNANRLMEMRNLRIDLQSEVHRMIIDYDCETVDWTDME